jgi:hypothetical protein
MYLSAASRTTQANETFFSFAISSSVSYISGGKLIDARTAAALSAFIFDQPFLDHSGLPELFTTLHHSGELSKDSDRFLALPSRPQISSIFEG